MAKRPSKTCHATSLVAVAVEDIQSNVVGSAFVATRMAPPDWACPDAGAPEADHIRSGTTHTARIRATAFVRTRHHPPPIARAATAAGRLLGLRASWLRSPRAPIRARRRRAFRPARRRPGATGTVRAPRGGAEGDEREAGQRFFFSISTK